jgi:hypothetical protein
VYTVDGPAIPLTIDGPVACVIQVQGGLDPRWFDRLGGLRVTVSGDDAAGERVTSELRGELLDQAALFGVLTTLYDLRLPLIGVACSAAQPAAPPPERRTALPEPAGGAARSVVQGEE